MGTMNYTGQEMTSREVLQLTRPAAAAWWCDAIDPSGTFTPADPVREADLCEMRRTLGLTVEALRYAAESEGVYCPY